VGVLQGTAAAERARFEESLKQAEAEHRERLAALAREESSVKDRLAALETETNALKAQAERLRAKASDRLIRRRAAHERTYVQARQAAESRDAADQIRLAGERAAVQSLEARLSARRRRMETLRARRRDAVAALLAGARSSLEAAVEAQRRTEGLVQERVAALKKREASWQMLRKRWADAPRWIADSEEAGAARVEMTSGGEMARLLADAERRGEEVRQAFVQNAEALRLAAARFKAAEASLDRDETDFREVLDLVEAQTGRLARLKDFFQAVRLPAAAAQDDSAVA
jgi:hypothetical protein